MKTETGLFREKNLKIDWSVKNAVGVLWELQAPSNGLLRQLNPNVFQGLEHVKTYHETVLLQVYMSFNMTASSWREK